MSKPSDARADANDTLVLGEAIAARGHLVTGDAALLKLARSEIFKPEFEAEGARSLEDGETDSFNLRLKGCKISGRSRPCSPRRP